MEAPEDYLPPIFYDSEQKVYLPPPIFYNSYRRFSPYQRAIFQIIPIRRRTYFSSSNKQSKLHFTKLLSSQLMYDNEARRKELELNLLDFRINQVVEFYTLKEMPISRFQKIIASHNFPVIITAIMENGNLTFCKQDGKEGSHNNYGWRLSDIDYNFFEDLLVHKRKIYAINRKGHIFRIIDSRMQVVRLRVPPCGKTCGRWDHKYLVECCGEIYVVNRLEDPSKQEINFKVYRLDEEKKRKDGFMWIIWGIIRFS